VVVKFDHHRVKTRPRFCGRSTNRGKRLARAPKLQVVDTGLAAALLGLDGEAIRRDRSPLRPLLESFVDATSARAWA
jgi:hypothetical protein